MCQCCQFPVLPVPRVANVGGAGVLSLTSPCLTSYILSTTDGDPRAAATRKMRVVPVSRQDGSPYCRSPPRQRRISAQAADAALQISIGYLALWYRVAKRQRPRKII